MPLYGISSVSNHRSLEMGAALPSCIRSTAPSSVAIWQPSTLPPFA